MLPSALRAIQHAARGESREAIRETGWAALEVAAPYLGARVVGLVRSVRAEVAAWRLASLRQSTVAVVQASGGAAAADAVMRASSSSRVLAANLAAAGSVRQPGWAAHHIVAGGAPEAAEARGILRQFGITDINAAENGVLLPMTEAAPGATIEVIHLGRHSGSYYRFVNSYLRGAASRSDVLERIDELRGMLRSGELQLR